MHFVIIGHPSERRVQFFHEAAQKYNCTCQIVPYQGLLTGKDHLERYLQPNTCLRIESFGEDFEVYKQLLVWGAEAPAQEPFAHIEAKAALQLPFDKGRIQYLRQFYWGFSLFLTHIEKTVATFPSIKLINTPASIQLSFDKLRCQQHLATQGLPTPACLGQVKSYDHLQALLDHTTYPQVFLKPSHSSSASGIMAYRRQGNKEQLITSIELVGKATTAKLYNHLKVRSYQNREEIETIVDTMAQEYLFTEQWLPKASISKGAFDLRVVVIDGQPYQTVARVSPHPITNLHLGNQRAAPAEVKAVIGESQWEALRQLAAQAVRTIEGAYCMGADILLDATHKKMKVLELNAFGDLLPNLHWQGENTYETIVKQQLITQKAI
ncbi:MAG: STM4014 family protein [Thermonemataceae bacterium]